MAQSINLTGDFVLEGTFRIGGGHNITLELLGDNKSKLSLIFYGTGGVTVDDVFYSPSGAFYGEPPCRILISGKGTRFDVIQNDNRLGSKDLGTVSTFKSLKIGMYGTAYIPLRSYFRYLKVVGLPTNNPSS